MSISKLKEPIRDVLLFGVVFTMVTVVAEGVFRLLGDHPSADLEGLYAPFGKGSYRLGPNVDTSASWAAGPWSVSTDSLGLRCDRDRALAVRKGDHLDFLMLGDSQGFGHGVDYEQSLVGVTAGLASEAEIRIANTSVGGHGSDNQLEIAHWLLEDQGIRAKHVVYLCTPNVVRYPGTYSKSVVGADGRLYSHELSGGQAWRASLESAAKRDTVVYGRFRDAVRNLNIGTKPAEEGGHMLKLYAKSSEPAGAGTPIMEFMGDLRELATGFGASAIVVYVPLTVELEFEAIAETAVRAGRAVEVDEPSRILAEAAEAAGIGFFDLKPALVRAKAEGLPLRLRADFHYSTDVSALCAEDLWTYLRGLTAPSE